MTKLDELLIWIAADLKNIVEDFDEVEPGKEASKIALAGAVSLLRESADTLQRFIDGDDAADILQELRDNA